MKKQIVYTEPVLEVDDNICIVASSINLLDNKYGKEIDGFDDVARFNRAPTDRFEEYVGAKTTIRIANNHVFANIPHTGWATEGQPTNFIKNQKNSKIVRIGPHPSNMPIEQARMHIDETSTAHIVPFNDVVHQMRYAKESWVSSNPLRSDFIPSIGIAFVWMCIESDITPHLFGFGVDEPPENATHYWEECKVAAGPCHRYSVERDMLREMEANKKVIIHR